MLTSITPFFKTHNDFYALSLIFNLLTTKVVFFAQIDEEKKKKMSISCY